MGILSFGKKNVRFDKVLSKVNEKSTTRNTIVEVNNVVQLSTGTIITGVLICPDNCYFNGRIDGNIEAKNKLVLGENSEVRGSVSAQNLISKGRIIGDLIIKNKSIFSSSTIVDAENLQTGLLEVENGATLNFKNISMRTNGLDESVYVSKIEYEPIVDTKIKTRKTGSEVKEKTASDVSPTNNNDNTFLFQIFQDKENNSK